MSERFDAIKLDELLQSLRFASVQALFIDTQSEATNAIIGIRSKIMGEFDQLTADLAAARARIAELEAAAAEQTCEWREEMQSDWGSSWETACGTNPYYEDGDCPTDNGYICCHHCGKRIVLVPLPPDQGEEG